MDIHTEILPKHTEELVNKLKDIPNIKNFYLSGGTGLALQLGHRESEDLDFFSQEKFDVQNLQQQLQTLGKLANVETPENTLNLFLENIKLQFLYYPYSLLEKSVAWNGILISSIVDIGCTKLVTVSSRGSKKDFIDIYFILKLFSLKELFQKLDQKYQNINYNQTHILKSLTYFENAEIQPMPRMHKNISWEEVKKAIIESVKNYSF